MWWIKMWQFLLLLGYFYVSILVLLDVPLKVLIERLNIRTLILFQSLFFWMCRWKADSSVSIYSPVSQVSILVLLDVPLKDSVLSGQYEEIMKFQSLFFWMCHWKYRTWHKCLKHNFVSILVLLDVPLKVPVKFVEQPFLKGFNPCSFGCAIERTAERLPLRSWLPFQSLFFWMCHWKSVVSA